MVSLRGVPGALFRTKGILSIRSLNGEGIVYDENHQVCSRK